MKRHLVGTAPGRFLHQTLQWLDLKSIPLHNPEHAARIANQIIAQTLIAGLCPRGGTFVDVGAHLGAVFSMVHRNDHSARIIAFEADPLKARRLQASFPFCTVHAVAVGETTGPVQFYLDSTQTAYSSLVQLENRTQTPTQIDCVRLDDALANVTPDIIKIDIEGAELGALRGGRAVIESHTPTLLFESAHRDTNSLGYAPDALWAWLTERGYGLYAPDRLAHTAPALSLEVFLDAHDHPRRTVDFFAVHPNQHIQIRARARTLLGI